MLSRSRIIRLTVLVLVAAAASTFNVAGSAAAPTLLNGAVGVGGPTITLKKNGVNVTRVVAGTYTFRINDVSAHHNFHLTGPGRVDRKTRVGATGVVNWTVTLRPGTYTYLCDPHSTTMKKTFRVVSAS